MGDKIRIKFSKHGNIRFIGHLDVMRYFQKAIRRAGIDIAYTEGFSPHQIMSFASPLGVGLESDGEYMDVVINSHQGGEKVMVDSLNAVMAEGIRVECARLLPDHAQNAMASITAAGYLVKFRDGFTPKFQLADALPTFLAQEHIIISKKTKKNELELDLKPAIFELAMRDGAVYMLVNASSSGNIKPKMVIEALYSFMNEELPEYALHITRTDLYTDCFENDIVKRVPLSAVGETFS